MTRLTRATAKTADAVTPTPPVEDTPEARRAFKENAVTKLHAWADGKNVCETFDVILEQSGLPGRNEYYERARKEPLGFRVEDDSASFEAWRQRTSVRLHEQAQRHGYERRSYERDLIDAGFLPHAELYRQVVGVVEGTFRFERTVTVSAGQDLISHFTNDYVRRHVYDGGYPGGSVELNWKVTDRDAPEVTVEPEAVETPADS